MTAPVIPPPTGAPARLAVLGSPIDHSRSPAIHRAAYAVLGLPWAYEAVDVTGDTLTAFLDSRDDTWRGLSLTMPLKREILPLLRSRHPLVDLVGGANTLLLPELRGFNTDVPGVVRSFLDAGVERLRSIHVLGAGATAAAAIAGAADLGATRAAVSARRPERAHALLDLGVALGVAVTVHPWDAPVDPSVDAVISTLPGGEYDLAFDAGIRETAVLFDVAYAPWPSVLAAGWLSAGGRVVSGIDLLVNQAIGQIRVFVGGDPELPLPEEPAVVEAMRSAALQSFG